MSILPLSPKLEILEGPPSPQYIHLIQENHGHFFIIFPAPNTYVVPILVLMTKIHEYRNDKKKPRGTCQNKRETKNGYESFRPLSADCCYLMRSEIC